MLQGLMVRKLFIALDLAIVIVAVFSGGYVAARAMGFEPGGALGISAALIPDDTEALGLLASVGERSSYESLVKGGLFGPAGLKPTAPPVPEAPKEETPEVTDLKLKLIGTAATAPKDPLATAIILNELNNTTQTFAIGQDVVDQVILDEVHPRMVYLQNKQKNKREVLYSENVDVSGPATVASAGSSGPGASGAPSSGMPGRVTVNRTKLMQEMMLNYADIATTVRPELSRDGNGNVIGLTGSNLETLPMAKELGIQEGDVLQSVNNETIDSEAKVMELVNKYRDAKTLRIGILRNGSPVTVMYTLE